MDYQKRDIGLKRIYMSRYRKDIEIINHLMDRLKTLESRMLTPKHQVITDMPGGGQPKTIEDLEAEKVELQNRIYHRQCDKAIHRKDVITQIDKLDDLKQIEVMEYLFLDGLDPWQCADRMNYSKKWIDTLYYRAMERIDLPE